MNTDLPEPDINLEPGDPPEIPLPKGWTGLTLQAILHVIALARIAILNAGNWPSDRTCDGLRLRVENVRLPARGMGLRKVLDDFLSVASKTIFYLKDFLVKISRFLVSIR